MHRIFDTRDIIHLIVDQFTPYSICPGGSSDAAALARLGRVQKNLGEIALNRLWESVTLEALMSLFNEDVASIDEKSGKMLFFRTPREEDLTRFRVYAPKIRVLHRPDTENHVNVHNILEHLFRSNMDEGVAFPSLRVLRWFGASLIELPLLSLFVTSTLASFFFTLDYMFSDSHPTPLPLLESPLISLAKFPNLSLREFWMPVLNINTPMPVGLQLSCLALLKRSSNIHLTQVSIVPSPSILCALAALPNLKWLILNVRRWSPESTAPVNETYESVLHPFPALEILTVHTSHLSQLLTLFSSLPGYIQCHPCKSISIDTEHTPPSSDVRTLLSIFLPTTTSNYSYLTPSKFESFRLFSSEARHTDPLLGRPLTLEDLSPLLALGCMGRKGESVQSTMRHFEIDAPGLKFELGDVDLEDIATAWPNLSCLSLKLNTPRFNSTAPITTFNSALQVSTETMGEKQITLKGLISLARLRHLTYLTLPTFKVTDPAVQEWPLFNTQSSSSSMLTFLSIGPSLLSLSLTQPFAAWIKQWFPNLRHLWCWERNREGRQAWEKVRRELEMV